MKQTVRQRFLRREFGGFYPGGEHPWGGVGVGMVQAEGEP